MPLLKLVEEVGSMNRAFIVVGLAYGDEGKGSWVDHLVRKHDIKYVVRFNGGVQAHHHVVREDGKFHGFRQFSSGSFVPGVTTVLSKHMLIEPEYLLEEAKVLGVLGSSECLSRVLISENSGVITPFARLLNQIQEAYRGKARHGSTGFGIGITQRDLDEYPTQALRARDLRSPFLFEKLQVLAEAAIEEAEEYRSPASEELFQRLLHSDLNHYTQMYRGFTTQVRILSDIELGELLRGEDLVFEGAQGVLLDQDYGFFPHVTRSRCTFANAESLLKEMEFRGSTTRIGLLRAYGTRHGAGPFVTEEKGLPIQSCHNGTNVWQGNFRLGWFDAVSARYALKVVDGVDILGVTNFDRLEHFAQVKFAHSYSHVDSEYFEDNATIRVIGEDIRSLSRRCDVLDAALPQYTSLSFTGDREKDLESYLRGIAVELGRDVDAVSLSPLHHKIYR